MADLISQVVADLRARGVFAGRPRLRAEAARAAVEAGLTAAEWPIVLSEVDRQRRRDAAGERDLDYQRVLLVTALRERESLQDLLDCAADRAKLIAAQAPSHYSQSARTAFVETSTRAELEAAVVEAFREHRYVSVSALAHYLLTDVGTVLEILRAAGEDLAGVPEAAPPAPKPKRTPKPEHFPSQRLKREQSAWAAAKDRVARRTGGDASQGGS